MIAIRPDALDGPLRVDLHMHSTASDGAYEPQQVMERAARAGMTHVALTDHDTVEGLAVAARAANALGIGFIPGVELSAMHAGREVHILGYWIDAEDRALVEALAAMRDERSERIARMISLLRVAGYDVDPAAVTARASGSVSRVHLAQELVATGAARDFTDAFTRFIDEGAPYYIPRKRRTVRETVDLIESAGGVAVVAHPARSGVAGAIEELASEGVIGVEAFHSDQSAAETAALIAAAEANGLSVTGGSDYHGLKAGDERIGGGLFPSDYAARFLALGER